MRVTGLVVVLALAGAGPALAQPSLGDAAHALETKWKALMDSASEERTVSFESIEAGQPNGDSYPFRVTATVRDYDAGYPPNGYFGSTCTMRFTDEVFTMRPDAFGGWDVQGRMNVFDDQRCADNAAEGVSSIPLESVPGQPASSFGSASAAQPLRPEDRRVTEGEWVCYGYDQTILFSFVMDADGAYQQGDEVGAYSYDGASAVIAFASGPLAGRNGTAMDGNGFQLAANVSCQAST